MNKYVSFGTEEVVIEYNIDITYVYFLEKIQNIFNLKEDSYDIMDLTENNFNEMMATKDHFNVVMSEKYKALERLDGKNDFEYIETIQEAKDFFLVYGFVVEEDGTTPLHWAAYKGHTEIAGLILEKDFKNVHRVYYLDVTPLNIATYYGHAEIVELLLEKDFDNAHQAAKYGETPLSSAVSNGHAEIVKLLEKDIERRKNNI